VRRVTGYGQELAQRAAPGGSLAVGGGATEEVLRKSLRPVATRLLPVKVLQEFGYKKVRYVRELDSYDDRNYLLEAVAPEVAMRRERRRRFLGIPRLVGFVVEKTGDLLVTDPVSKVTNTVRGVLRKVIGTRGQGKVSVVVKVSNGVDTERGDTFIHAQTQVMALMDDYDILTNKVILHTSHPIKAQDGCTRFHHIRLLSYVPGLAVARIDTMTSEIFYNMGVFVAGVSRALRRFDHPAVHRVHLWDNANFMSTAAFVKHIMNNEHRRLVLMTLRGFQLHVVPHAHQLPKQIIHNDMNDTNILVTANKGQLSFAVIDWGDMVLSWRVNEIATTMAYMMLRNSAGDILQDSLHVLEGYLSLVALKEIEWMSLYWCIAARLSISCTMSAYSYSRDKSNKYLLHTAEPGWRALGQLLLITPKQFLEKITYRHALQKKKKMPVPKKPPGVPEPPQPSKKNEKKMKKAMEMGRRMVMYNRLKAELENEETDVSPQLMAAAEAVGNKVQGKGKKSRLSFMGLF